jgi:hypothetical protein
MKYLKTMVSMCLSVLFAGTMVYSQSGDFNIDLYKNFLTTHQDLSTEQLLEMHPAGLFEKKINSSWHSALYHDSIETKFELSEDEISLINKHGFVVTSRLSSESFGNQFLDIYHKDMPVFLSTDAILHAFHSSYDRILKDVELQVLIPKLNLFLESLHTQLPVLADKYKSYPKLTQMFKDVDVYLTIPRKLLDPDVAPLYSENESEISRFMDLIESLQFTSVNIFTEDTPRKVDFSQFKPRGHYTDPYNTVLADYFKAMIWLGRIEIYLIPPRSLDVKPTFADMQRQIIDAALISELVNMVGDESYTQIEKIVSYFVGEQDNVTLANLEELKESILYDSPADLLDSLKIVEFQNILSLQPYAQQRILSQVLMNDPMNPDSIIPASAFLMFGQRFIIDSYVTGNVVWDRIKNLRMLPSTLDIMFALGNDATIHLLQPELIEYQYAPNIAALRFLLDSYDNGFWYSTIYNMWLNSIRTLNPPTERNSLPAFMQTAAWWQQKLNTQLASWTELRHDNLLYAKQSYSGGVICSYPYSYIEPIPEFYNRMRISCTMIKGHIEDMPFENESFGEYVASHFERWREIMDTLRTLAQKELDGLAFSDQEVTFLNHMISEQLVCGGVYDGWYPDLFYDRWSYEEGFLKKDYLVADYHTAPTDATGTVVGWVAHAGTGPVEMAILNAKLPSGQNVAFIGPVSSYFEYTSTNFFRLTDEEWKDSYLDKAMRPEWTNLYRANIQGLSVGDGPSLLTSTGDDPNIEPVLPESYLIASNYPNPFNYGTMIQFNIPYNLTNQRVKLTIFDIRGKMVNTLVNRMLPSGNYFTRWNGIDTNGRAVASGIYFYSLTAGQNRFVGKMQLIK